MTTEAEAVVTAEAEPAVKKQKTDQAGTIVHELGCGTLFICS